MPSPHKPLPLAPAGIVQVRVIQLVSELTRVQQAQSEAAVREREGRAVDAKLHRQEAEAERRAWEKKMEQVCVCVVAGGGSLTHTPSGGRDSIRVVMRGEHTKGMPSRHTK